MTWSAMTDGARVALAVLVAWVAWRVGAAPQLCMAVLVMGVPVTLGLKVWHGARGDILRDFARAPFRADRRGHLAVFALRAACFAVLAGVMESTLLEWQMEAEALSRARTMLWGSAGLHVVLGLFPTAKQGRVVPVLLGMALCTGLWQAWVIRVPAAADPLPLRLAAPVSGTWHVLMGGPSPFLNHHAVAPSMRDALDLVLLAPDGRWITGAGTAPTDFPSYGQPVLAPADATVVTVENALADPVPGVPARDVHPMGNRVVLRVDGKAPFHVLLGHLQRGSITVKPGDSVACGQQLGRVGNSGGAGAPHLHVQAMTAPDVLEAATRSLPVRFSGTTRRDGQPLADDLRVQRGDVLAFTPGCPAP